LANVPVLRIGLKRDHRARVRAANIDARCSSNAKEVVDVFASDT
jgi:hypothetical protein